MWETLTNNNKSKEKQHIAVALDLSGSMTFLTSGLRNHYNSLINEIKKESELKGIKTRFSLYRFGGDVKTVMRGNDVKNLNRMEFVPNANMGGTALIDAARVAVCNLDLNFDESGLVYIITDGGENASYSRDMHFMNNWKDRLTLTIACPAGYNFVSGCEKLGFEKGNIVEWETSKEGLEEHTVKVNSSIKNYYNIRSTGVKKTSKFFELDMRIVDPREARRKLKNVKSQAKGVWTVPGEKQISDFVTEKVGWYQPGSCYYEITKPEKVGENKELLLMRKGGRSILRGKDIREVKEMLGMPVTGEVKVDPADLERWRVFVQSYSNNRKLVRGSRVVCL